ncbi:pVII [Tree shrew adenovirus 1]|uniref:PVII n=1 Tax=Tree shrew adenovirus serotype 1 TaxID=47680 RepID=A0A2U9AG94_ADET1|nr:pVII [Tree shrew adenovirus 1]AWO77104.1 pVII [Tree shrew adenovirus 1]
MAILVSPSNNSGWGLGVKSMYGGARKRSAAHPVLVKKHYRAPWGTNRRSAAAAAADATEAVAEAVAETVAARVRRRRRPRRRRARVIPGAALSMLRRAAARARKRPRRRVRNVYLVRDASGNRVPVVRNRK